jgi:hypothetical protein
VICLKQKQVTTLCITHTVYTCTYLTVQVKSCPITGLDSPLGLQEVEAARISRQSAHGGGKVVSPTHRPPLATSRYAWYSFFFRLSRPQGYSAAGKSKSLQKSSGPWESNPCPFAVLQPTALLRTHVTVQGEKNVSLYSHENNISLGSIQNAQGCGEESIFSGVFHISL